MITPVSSIFVDTSTQACTYITSCLLTFNLLRYLHITMVTSRASTTIKNSANKPTPIIAKSNLLRVGRVCGISVATGELITMATVVLGEGLSECCDSDAVTIGV